MPLFDQILAAVQSPNQQANPDQLSTILGAVQQLSAQNGVSPNATQDVLSMLTGYVRSSLQQKRASGGSSQLESILNQASGPQSASAVGALFTSAQQTQISQAISQKTGIDARTVAGMVSVLIPVVLSLLKTGAPTSGSVASGNPVLNSFLDADGDGDVDLADTLNMASRFLQK
jgi:uncharacterized protein YidB (DUF937 family)